MNLTKLKKHLDAIDTKITLLMLAEKIHFDTYEMRKKKLRRIQAKLELKLRYPNEAL